MSSVPIALWNLKVPSGGLRVPGYDDEDGSPLPYRITMAAIDSSVKSTKPSTLKCHRRVVTAVAEDSDDEDEEMDDAESTEEEFIICTLEAGKTYQQTLDITMPEDDEIYFSTSGDLPIYLSGNYVTPLNMESDSESEYDEDEENDLYDESPDEDELIFDDDEDEEDELDDLDGRIEEITEDLSARIEGESKGKSKGTKRPREEEEEAPELVDTSKKSVADDIDMSGLSKSQKKKLKKQRRESNESNPVNGSEKKVQFDTTPKGPSPSASESTVPAKPALSTQVKSESKPAAKKEKKTLANGVVIEDAKIGSGPMAKSGSKLAVRYIGKLKNGKVFDKNTKGAPFRFVLGKGEVITGWDVGMAGMQVGGERKLHVPAAAAYGSKKLPDIPPNSDLIFDVKCVGVN